MTLAVISTAIPHTEHDFRANSVHQSNPSCHRYEECARDCRSTAGSRTSWTMVHSGTGADASAAIVFKVSRTRELSLHNFIDFFSLFANIIQQTAALQALRMHSYDDAVFLAERLYYEGSFVITESPLPCFMLPCSLDHLLPITCQVPRIIAN
jgi:hypothetical protein